jgi:hypothetical protein
MKPKSSSFALQATSLVAIAVAALPATPCQAQGSPLSTPFVISRIQLVYSMVSHRQYLSDRVHFYNVNGNPAGNDQYASPMLACDPLVTLYNPANSSASRSKVRVMISDPPVGFKFKKNADYLRSDFATGFQPMARFQIDNEANASARKKFIMLLRELGVNQTPGAAITLGPGESRTYAPWVEDNWTWGLETAGGYTARAFYDWLSSNSLTTEDGRTNNPFGVEAVSGWNPIAGFQTDHLSTATARPAATRYDFEIAHNMSGGWVSIRNQDTVTVEAKAMRAIPASGLPDFQVDLLGGNVVNTTSDGLRSFPMSLGELPALPQITRLFAVEDLLQAASEDDPGGKTPFLVVTMIAKTSALRENRFYETPPLPAGDLYELHFTAITDFDQNDNVSASDRLAAGFKINEMTRSGDQVFLDFSTGPEIEALRITGTASLAEGFNEDLSEQTISIPGPPGSGLHKAIVNVADKGPRYFIRIEELPGL